MQALFAVSGDKTLAGLYLDVFTSAPGVGGIKDATQTVIGLPVHAFRLVWKLVEHADVPRLTAICPLL